MAAAPKRKSAPPPPQEKAPFPIIQLVLIVVMVAAIIGLVVFLLTHKAEEPPPPPPPPPVSKPATKPKTDTMSTIKNIPPEVMKEIYQRLDKYSSMVDPLERREAEADKITEAEKRYDEYEKLSDLYAENREGIGDVLDDPKYRMYKEDSAYGPTWQGYENRMKYWQTKMNSIKKKRDQAFIELKAIKEKAGK